MPIKIWTRDELIAYDAFLWSEEIRHQEDIDAIRKKRAILHEAGFKAEDVGPWITEEEIKASGKVAFLKKDWYVRGC